MLDYVLFLYLDRPRRTVGWRQAGTLVHVRRAAVSMESSTKERERAGERERGEDAEKCEHGEGHGRGGAVKKH